MPPNQEDSEPARRAALTAAARGQRAEEWAGHIAVMSGGDTIATRFSGGVGGRYWFDFDPVFAATLDWVLLVCGVQGLWFLVPRAYLHELAARPEASRSSQQPPRLEFSIDAATNRLTYAPSPAPKPFVLRFRKKLLE